MGKTLGKKIREMRKRRGLTQSDLGQGLATASMISQIESDKANPSQQLLTLLAQKLETPIDYFLQSKLEEHERYAELSLANALVQAGRYPEAYELLIMLADRLRALPVTNRPLRATRAGGVSSNEIDGMHIVEFLIGVCELETGSREQAEDRFEDLLETALTLQDVRFYLNVSVSMGQCCCRSNRVETAAHIWNRAIEYAKLHQYSGDPVLLELNLKLGEAYDALGSQQQAQRVYENAQRFWGNPANWDQVLEHMLEQAASCYQEQNHQASAYYSQQFACIQSTSKRINSSYQSSIRLAVCLGQDGQFEEAQRLLQEIRSNDWFEEHALQWYIAKARIDSWAGDYDSAYAGLCDRFPHHQPTDKIQADGFALAGEIFIHFKKFQEAERLLQAALDWHLRHEEKGSILADYELLGNLYKQQGNLEAAIECFEQIHLHNKKHNLRLDAPNSGAYGNERKR